MPRSTITRDGEPTIALQSTTRAALTSLLLFPLLLHIAPMTAVTHKRNETSRHNRRMMVIEGERFSSLVKMVDIPRRVSIVCERGLRTNDHIPRSSMSHLGTLFPSLGEPRPPSHWGDPREPGDIFDRETNSERDSSISKRSDSAAKWTCTFSTACSKVKADIGRTSSYCEGCWSGNCVR